MPEKPDSSNEPAARGNRRGRRRLPVLPIVLLLVVAFLILAFVTFRQLRSAREHRLRLLAGFSDRIEQTIPRLAARFASIIQEQDYSGTIEDYVEIVPNLQMIGEPQGLTEAEAARRCTGLTKGGDDIREIAGASAPCLVLQSRNDQIELVYVGEPKKAPLQPEPPPGGSDAASDTESAEEEDQREGQTTEDESVPTAGREDWGEQLVGPHIFVGRIELRTLLRDILISDVFDSVLVASRRTGRVLHQEGEPALVVADLASLLTRAEPAFDLARDGPATAIVDVTLGTASDEWFSEGEYKLFMQPVSLTANLPGGMNVAAEPWIIAGLISDENLLASGFSTSPLLLFILVISFPSALIAWPFLKLWLISPRQSMTRLDIAALVASSLLGLTLATLLIFDLLFLSRLHHRVDQQLTHLSETLQGNLLHEIHAMWRQLDALAAKGEEIERLGTLRQVQSLVEDTDLDLQQYPYFHSVFWADRSGVQRHKLPLRSDAIFTSWVGSREYFQCARQRRGYRLDALPDQRICIEAIFSNTTGRDLVALARPIDATEPGDPGEVQEPASPEASTGDAATDAAEDPLEVAVLTGNLLSLRHPVIPPSFGFAVIDPSGRAVFHSDERRNMTENFLKASDENHLLSALLASRRPGHLTARYWGDRSRMHLNPIKGLPWTLVVFRSAADLRLRNFEVIYDFLNGMLPYLLLVLLILLAMVVLLRVSLLWPTERYTVHYRLVILVVTLLTGLFSIAVAFAGPGLLFWSSLAVPGFTFLALLWSFLHRWLRQRRSDAGSGERAETRFRRLTEAAIFGGAAVLAIVAWVGNPGFISGFLCLATLFAASTWWLWLQSYFGGTQRRLAFIGALAALLFATAIVPSVGLFQLASSRQLQYLVQDSQAGLAERLEARRRHLESTRSVLEARRANLFEAYDRSLEEKDSTLSAFFHTKEVGPGNWCGVGGKPPWPISRPNDSPLYLTLLTARPVPLSELATERQGLDLSRFQSSPHEWRLHDDERPLIGEFKGPWETGSPIYLASELFSRATKNVQPLRFAIVVLALLVLVPLPGFVSRFLADRVLLARLVKPRPQSRALDDLLPQWRKEADLRHILLVTSVPDLAVREAERSGRYDVRSLEGGHPSGDADETPDKTTEREENENR